MLLLGFHIVSIGMVILVAGLVGYRMGFQKGVRRATRAMELRAMEESQKLS